MFLAYPYELSKCYYSPMNDEQRLRYSRHILLPEVGEQGQEILLDSHVVIIGLGGLGSAVALYLAAAGVGKITLVDDDYVELGNLQRQVVHQTSRIGQMKVESAQQQLRDINPDIQLEAIPRRLSDDELAKVAEVCDLVLDCTDNFPSRFTINRACQQAATPLVSAAAIRMQGQVSVFMPEGPCYRCLYADESKTVDTCAERGVIGPLLGVMGSMQALEAIKVLAQVGRSLEGRLLMFDAMLSDWRTLQLSKDPECPVCSQA